MSNVVDDAIGITNKGSQVAVKYTPNFAKNTLTGIKHMGAWGVGLATDNKFAKWAANKSTELENKVRTGAKMMFNAGFGKSDGSGGIKTVGDYTKTDSVTQVMIIIIFILFFLIFFWCYKKIGLNDKNCNTIEKVYNKFPLISSIDPKNPLYQNKLRDYYIKTAYNCCAGGNFKNDFVNLCALRNCIKQGARCLDFEIYSVNNKPVVAVSSASNVHVKESYNAIGFDKAMDAISKYAFSGSNCPNPKDPLILHFRIMTNSMKIHDEIAKELYNNLQDKLLGKQFSYENTGKNIGSYPINLLMDKVIIMVDKKNPLFTTSMLNEYVNITSNSAFVRLLRYNDVVYCPDKDELIEYNQQNMTISLPNLSPNNKNYSAALVQTYGCQMIGMSFQNFDNNLQYYTQIFDDAGSAFVLRPDIYRYVPVFVAEPPKQDPKLSFADVTFLVHPDLPPKNI